MAAVFDDGAHVGGITIDARSRKRAASLRPIRRRRRRPGRRGTLGLWEEAEIVTLVSEPKPEFSPALRESDWKRPEGWLDGWSPGTTDGGGAAH